MRLSDLSEAQTISAMEAGALLANEASRLGGDLLEEATWAVLTSRLLGRYETIIPDMSGLVQLAEAVWDATQATGLH